ncbi:MAG: SDR family NAD(P)-dependent oxidoreductase, partial [SAR324 cluster bacterium]|nr:SDR family NAD(P)-dependent oxidoreductase [SAR324 cluster bacterium]
MDKVLIVTGGSRGIGAATARIASRRGYAVCVNFLKNKAAATQIADKI